MENLSAIVALGEVYSLVFRLAAPILQLLTRGWAVEGVSPVTAFTEGGVPVMMGTATPTDIRYKALTGKEKHAHGGKERNITTRTI